MNRKVIYNGFFLCLALFACSSKGTEPEPTPTPSPEPPHTEGVAIFEDHFDTFNSAVWTKETHQAGWTNNELQSYSPSNVTVGKDGDRTVLMLTATHKDGKIVSGRVNSKGKMKFGNGTIEASIKLPRTANGLWPAFWMMGNNNKEWPACGEIDIMEMGDAEGIRLGTWGKRVNSALHYGPTPAGHQQDYYAGDAAYSLQDGQYHTYTLKRNGKTLEVLIDLKPFHTFDIDGNSYMQGDFYALFNLAVGGDFMKIYNAGDVTALKEGEKAVMYIDWIRIFDK